MRVRGGALAAVLLAAAGSAQAADPPVPPRPARKLAAPPPPAASRAALPIPEHAGPFSFGPTFGVAWSRDGGHDLYSADGRDSSIGLSVAYRIRFLGPRLSLFVGGGFRREGDSAALDEGRADAKLRSDAFFALGQLDFKMARWLGAQAALALGGSRAHLSIEGTGRNLADTSGSAFGRLGAGLELRTPPGVAKDIPLFGVAFAVEAGWTLGTSYLFELTPTTAPRDPIPASGVEVGDVSPSGPYLSFAIRVRR